MYGHCLPLMETVPPFICSRVLSSVWTTQSWLNKTKMALLRVTVHLTRRTTSHCVSSLICALRNGWGHQKQVRFTQLSERASRGIIINMVMVKTKKIQLKCRLQLTITCGPGLTNCHVCTVSPEASNNTVDVVVKGVSGSLCTETMPKLIHSLSLWWSLDHIDFTKGSCPKGNVKEFVLKGCPPGLSSEQMYARQFWVLIRYVFGYWTSLFIGEGLAGSQSQTWSQWWRELSQ